MGAVRQVTEGQPARQPDRSSWCEVTDNGTLGDTSFMSPSVLYALRGTVLSAFNCQTIYIWYGIIIFLKTIPGTEVNTPKRYLITATVIEIVILYTTYTLTQIKRCESFSSLTLHLKN